MKTRKEAMKSALKDGAWMPSSQESEAIDAIREQWELLSDRTRKELLAEFVRNL